MKIVMKAFLFISALGLLVANAFTGTAYVNFNYIGKDPSGDAGNWTLYVSHNSGDPTIHPLSQPFTFNPQVDQSIFWFNSEGGVTISYTEKFVNGSSVGNLDDAGGDLLYNASPDAELRYEVYFTGVTNGETFDIVNRNSAYADRVIGSTVHFQWIADDGVPPTTVTIQLSRNGGGWEDLAVVPYDNNYDGYGSSYDWVVTGPEADCVVSMLLRDKAGNEADDQENTHLRITPTCPDSDGDGVCDADDICPGHDDNVDSDGDTVPDGCDVCPGYDDRQDADHDGIPDGCDPCTDTDGDGYGDPGYPANTCQIDDCPNKPDPDQLDCNQNGIGDVCEPPIQCADPSNWTRTIGGAGYDAAAFATPIYDTTWTNTVTNHEMTAYYENSPLVLTVPEDQSIDYRLECGDDYPRYAQISKNGVVVDRLDNTDPSTFGTIVTGSFAAVEGDEVRIEVNPISQAADGKGGDAPAAAAVSTNAHFEYVTTETTVDQILFNSYLLAGTKTNESADFIAVSTDECGNVVDSANAGTADDDYAQAACLTVDHHVVVVGYTQSATDKSMVVSKFGYSGSGAITSDWSQTFSFSDDDRAYSVVEAYGGGYLVLGTTLNGSYSDLTVLKINTDGTLQWRQTYPTASDELAGEIIQSATGDGYYVVGTTGGPQPINYDVYIIRIDASGNQLWTSTIGQPGYYEIARAVVQSDDNNLIIAGQSSEDGYSDALLMKASGSNGALQWYKLIGGDGYENVFDVMKNGTSGYVLAGRTSQPAPSYWDCYFVITDNDGNLIWADTLGNADDDEAFSVQPTIDNGFILGGYSKGNCAADMYAVKFVPDYPGQPTLAYPIAGESFYDVELPLMDWSDVSNAESYRIQIDNNSDFSSPRVDQADITASEFQPPGPGTTNGLKENTYHWRVRGHNSAFGDGPWSSSGQFNVRYAKPTLISPSRYSTSGAGSNKSFSWEQMPDVGSNYRIQVATDNAFTNIVVDEIAGYCLNGYCSYTSSHAFSAGTYYWRVKSIHPNFYWSDAWSFTLIDINPSCPVLYSYNGTEFVQENPLLTACEQSGYLDVVTDYYQLNSKIAPKDGKITFQLREMENEITHLSDFELLTVDHSVDSRIGCSVDGQIFSYKASFSPISAVDQNGTDQLKAIAQTDGKLFKAEGAGSLTLTFSNYGTETGVAFGAPGKTPCLDNPPAGKEGVAQEKQPIVPHKFTVEQKSSNGSWTTLPTVPTRVNAAGELVMTNLFENQQSKNVTIRISWDDGFETDEIRQYIPSDEQPIVNIWKADNHTVLADNPTAKAWSGFNSAEPLELRKGDMIELTFDVSALSNPSLERTYIVRAVGKYEPDYAVYTNLLPNAFKMYNNYPNPFNPTTTIGFDLPRSAQVKLEVINLLGQTISTLVDGHQEAGHHEVVWDGKNSEGSSVASGVYFYRMTADTFTDSKKMLLLK